MDTTIAYLELLKKTLNFALWDEPGVHPMEKEEGWIYPQFAHTMIGMKRLNNLELAMDGVKKRGIPGDFIETGVWRGGACIFMKGWCEAHGEDRHVWVADSFCGLPPPDRPEDKDDKHYLNSTLAISLEQVQDHFSRYGLLDDKVHFLQGWFKDTLPTAPIDRLAVLRLDGDMYGSTMDALTYLYPKLNVGGFCIIDDWAINSCRQAVIEYATNESLQIIPIFIDGYGVYWRKEAKGTSET